MPVHALVDEGCGIELSIEAPEAPSIDVTEEDDSMHQIAFAFSGGFVECYIYGQELDPASSLDSLVALTAGEHASWYAIDDLGASVVEGRPYLHATAITRVDKEEQRLWGNVHFAVGTALFDTLACISNAPGNRKGFLRIFEGALRTLKTPATEAPEGLVYHSISVTTAAGNALVGFAESLYHVNADGTTMSEYFSSRLLRTVDLHLVGSDSAKVLHAEDGRVVAGTYVSGGAETVEYNLELRALEGDGDEYEAAGKLMDKDYETRFVAEGGLPDMRKDASDVARFVKQSSGRVLGLLSYQPSVDPSGAVTMFVQRKKRTATGIDAIVSVGEMEFTATIDEAGEIKSATMTLGGTEMRIEHVWQTGSLVN